MYQHFHLSRFRIDHTNLTFIPRPLVTLKIKSLCIITSIQNIYILIFPTIDINLFYLSSIRIPD